MTNLEISIEKKLKLTNSSLRKKSRLLVNLDRDFCDRKVAMRQDQDVSIKTSWLSRHAFWNCWDFLNHWDLLFASVEIKLTNYSSFNSDSTTIIIPTHCSFSHICNGLFIFYRYEFKSSEKVKLRELGPRFTLRLRSLQVE